MKNKMYQPAKNGIEVSESYNHLDLESRAALLSRRRFIRRSGAATAALAIGVGGTLEVLANTSNKTRAWTKFSADEIVYESKEYTGDGETPPGLTATEEAYLDALSKNSVSSANFQTIQDGPQVDKPNPYPQPGFPRMNWINCEENESEWVQKPNGKWIYRITLGEVVAVKEFVAGHNPPAQP